VCASPVRLIKQGQRSTVLLRDLPKSLTALL